MEIAKELELEDREAMTAQEDLLEGIGKGSLPAFERLYETHGGRMKSIAVNLLGNVADAEDAVQETFLKVYRGASRFRGGSSLSTWMFRILVNTCYDVMRKGMRHPEAALPASIALEPGKGTDVHLRLSIERALLLLPTRERVAFLLCEVEGFSHREASEVLEVNEATSRTLLFRAKRSLQKSLRAGGGFPAVVS